MMFEDCDYIEYLEFATSGDSVVSSIESQAFYSGASTSNINLTVGYANASMVIGSTLYIGTSSYSFKTITVLSE